jgi:hypothetical protein
LKFKKKIDCELTVDVANDIKTLLCIDELNKNVQHALTEQEKHAEELKQSDNNDFIGSTSSSSSSSSS